MLNNMYFILAKSFEQTLCCGFVAAMPRGAFISTVSITLPLKLYSAYPTVSPRDTGAYKKRGRSILQLIFSVSSVFIIYGSIKTSRSSLSEPITGREKCEI